MSEKGADLVVIRFSKYLFYMDFSRIFREIVANFSQILCGVYWRFLAKINYFLIFFQSVSEEGADRVEIFSDDDDDFSSPEEGSDSEPMLDDQVSTRR